jgi:hypothetical protein
MMEAQEKTRVQIGLVQPDDDMRQEFQGAIQKQEQSRIDLQFEQMLRPPEPKIDGVTGPTPKPAEGNQPAEVTIQPRSVGQMAGAAVSDVAGGAIEAPVQVVGGVMDALNEVSDALESVLPLGEMLGGIEIMDPETGEFTLRALSGEEMKAREDQVFEALAPAEAETVTGNFVRSASQFLTGFIPAMKGAKALGASGGIATQLGAGAVADAVVFDPHEDRLSTFLNEVPALAPIVPDYLAETDPAKVSELQGRLANAIEGAGLGVATEGLMKAFKYYRAARQAKLQNKPEATAEEAARDAIREAAREELIEPIDDAALRGLGDPDDAPIVVAREDDTLDTALTRLQETKARIEKADASDKVLSGIANLLDGLEAARKGTLSEGRTAGQSREFQEWFKGSKVVDDQGNPRIVYHGTQSELKPGFVFDEKRIGSANDTGHYGRGFYFASTEGEASYYGKNVGAFYLSMKNPLVLDNTTGDFTFSGHFLSWAPKLDAIGALPDELKTALKSRRDADKYVEENAKFIGWENSATGDEGIMASVKNPAPGYTDSISLRNARNMPQTEAEALEQLKHVFADEMERFHRDVYPDIELASESLSDFVRTSKLGAHGLSEKAKAAGHDGIIYGDEYIAFSSDQIKAVSDAQATDAQTAMDDLLDRVRAGVNVNLPKRPVATFLKDKGGIEPASEIAADMRSRGITAKTHPGLFRKGGLRSLDNIPANEVDLMDGRDVTDPATGYVTEQGWLDGLESELRGDPWYDAKTQAMVDEQIAPVEEMSAMLDELGINPREMGNEEIAARLDEIASENARLRALDEVPHPADQDLPEGYDPELEGDYPFSPTANDMRNLGDQVAESDAAQGALARPASKPKPKVFLNMARIKSREDVKEALQLFADADAEAINAKRRGKVSNAQTAREAQKEFTELTDLIGRKPGPMSAAEAVAARRMLTASGEQTVALARKAADPGATSADLYNFRRAMLVHYAIQSEVIAARTETARALQSWSIASRATKGAQGVVCVL